MVSNKILSGSQPKTIVLILNEPKDHDVGFSKEAVDTCYVTLNCSPMEVKQKGWKVLEKEGEIFWKSSYCFESCTLTVEKELGILPCSSSQGNSLYRENRRHNECPAIVEI